MFVSVRTSTFESVKFFVSEVIKLNLFLRLVACHY